MTSSVPGSSDAPRGDDPEPATDEETEHHYDPPWWVGHPVVKYPVFAVAAGTIAAFRLLHGDAEILVGGSLWLALSLFGFYAATLLQRGIIPPALPGPGIARAYPPAMMIWALGVIGACLGMIVSVLRAPGDTDRDANLGIYLFVASLPLGIIVQILSWDDLWPDRWRPPYLRRHPPKATSNDDEPPPEPPEDVPLDLTPRPRHDTEDKP